MSWTKVDKEKKDWEKEDKREKGWFGGAWFFDWFSGTFRGYSTKIEKEKETWTKIER